jgi:hypothetical protein
VCHTIVPAKTPATRVVIETRYKRYPVRPKAWRVKHEGKIKFMDDPGGEGYEIAREVLVCPACAAQPHPPTRTHQSNQRNQP